jgi:hypothetical protein
MSLVDSLALVASEPSPVGLWELRADLLGAGVPPDAPVVRVIGSFHDYLDRISTGVSSRDYSHLASKLDISAISGVILERLAEAEDSEDMAMGILSGALTEGLMVLATRQHVRAWEGELESVHRTAAWTLYEELWRWSTERNPELSPGRRRTLIDALLEPATSREASGLVKAVVIGRLFQIMVISRLPQDVAAALDQ